MASKPNIEFKPLTAWSELQQHWPFLRRGLLKLQAAPQLQDLDEGSLLVVALQAMNSFPNKGLCLVGMLDKKTCFVGIVVDNTLVKTNPTCLLVLGYSDGVPTAASQGLEFIAMWARANKFKSLQAWSHRINGSSFRLFEKVWKFRRKAILFSRNLS